LVVFGVWLFSIYRDGGIGIGTRFLYGLNVALFFLIGPLLSDLQGELGLRAYAAPVEPAVQLVLVAFLIYVVAAYWLFPWIVRERLSPGVKLKKLVADPEWSETHRILGWWLFGIGAASLTLNRFMFGIPTVRAVWSVANLLAETGLLLVCLSAMRKRQTDRVLGVMLMLGAYSLIFSATGGHIGGQFLKGLFLLCVWLLGQGFRWRALALACVIGLASFVPYQQWLLGRAQLRTAINEEAPFHERLSIAVGIFADPMKAFVQPESVATAYAQRGDYSELLAAALEHTPAREPYAHGDTLWESVLALVPRVFWPDKPVSLGGSATATRFTGIHFSEDTSIAISFLMELYINFGKEGVWLGSLLLGLSIAWLERKFFTMGQNYSWGAIAVILTTWTVSLDAHTFTVAAMTIPPGVLVAWGAGRLIPLARKQAKRMTWEATSHQAWKRRETISKVGESRFR
jgi:hypothetical protein